MKKAIALALMMIALAVGLFLPQTATQHAVWNGETPLIVANNI